jgi:hypothetical protein
MGYDCTLHVIDERKVRDQFVPRLLGKTEGNRAFRGRGGRDSLLHYVESARRLIAHTPKRLWAVPID